MFKQLPRLRALLGLTLITALLALLVGQATQNVEAAEPTARTDLMTRQKASTASSHDISFTMDASTSFDADDTIIIDFNEDSSGFTYDGASDAVGDYDFNDGTERTIVDVDDDCTGHAGANDVVVGVNDAAGILTITACGSMTASSSNATVNIEIGTAATGTNRITNPSAGTVDIGISGTYGDDASNIQMDIIADDQVVATATVNESMNFAISDVTIEFGTLDSGDDFFADDADGNATEVEAHTITVGTNATGGFVFTVNGSTLTNVTSDTIDAIGDTNTASSPGSEQFGMRATVSGGAGAVTAPYAAAGFALDTAAFPDEVGNSGGGPSDDATYSMRYVANIASSTEAGVYTSTLTYIATPTF